MIGAILGRINRSWRGPAIEIEIAGRTYRIGAGEPRAHLVLHRRGLLRRLAVSPSLAFGEGYMRGEIEVRGPLMDVLQGAYRSVGSMQDAVTRRALTSLRNALRSTSPRRAARCARHHYNLGNDFYRLWLDESMTYSCAYFLETDDDLAAAQRRKVELLCRKARLEPGMRMLDVGCGWGNLLFHAAEHHDVVATGVTPVPNQVRYIRDKAKRLGLEDRVQVIECDWRCVRGKYDRIVSVGMFEHVPRRLYAEFFRRWRDLLEDGGLSVLHTIGRMRPAPADPWIDRYIFPSGNLQPLHRMIARISGYDMSVMDVENLRRHYADTLAAWATNFQRCRPRVVAMYDESFARMWELYLHGSEAAFRWGGLHLWQIVIARDAAAPWPLNREVTGDMKAQAMAAVN